MWLDRIFLPFHLTNAGRSRTILAERRNIARVPIAGHVWYRCRMLRPRDVRTSLVLSALLAAGCARGELDLSSDPALDGDPATDGNDAGRDAGEPDADGGAIDASAPSEPDSGTSP